MREIKCPFENGDKIKNPGRSREAYGVANSMVIKVSFLTA
mgnify:CR=1 FL=1